MSLEDLKLMYFDSGKEEITEEYKNTLREELYKKEGLVILNFLYIKGFEGCATLYNSKIKSKYYA